MSEFVRESIFGLIVEKDFAVIMGAFQSEMDKYFMAGHKGNSRVMKRPKIRTRRIK